MSLQRSLLALIALVLVMALVPAWLLLERRLAIAMEFQAGQDLEMAPILVARNAAQTADAMMMHAKEIAGAVGLLGALQSGDDAEAIRIAERARAGYGEVVVVVSAEGRQISGPRVPASLITRTRRGEMPVAVVTDGPQLHSIAVAPVKAGSTYAGTAGVASSWAETEARALASLTRTKVVIVTHAGRVAVNTADSAEVDAVAAVLRAWTPSDTSVREYPPGSGLLARSMPLGDSASAIMIRDLARDQAMVVTLRRVGLMSALGAATLALGLGVFFAMRLARPVRSLASAADRLAAGDFHAPIERPALAELGRMADAFVAMRESLAQRLEELARANRELAQRQERLSALQSELIQRDRLATAGRLVAQLAHEIRNPVANVRNCLELIGRRVRGDTETMRFAELAIDELLRMHELAEQMLDLHRPRQDARQESDPSAIVNEVVTLVRIGSPASLELVVDAPSNGTAAIEPDALKQVLLNVVHNAREAMRDRGRIEIRTQQSENAVIIEVTDNGPGIPADVLPRMFDPFFTTKSSVHGVGLGLFVAEGIVRSVGGRITGTDRGDGHGARFIITLPRAVVTRADALA